MLIYRAAWVLLVATKCVVWSQHLNCPARDWTLGSTITLTCYLPRPDYPDKCTTAFSDEVKFTKTPFSGATSDICTLSDVSTSCTSPSSECSCAASNATFFILQHTFTVQSDDNGTWGCDLFCFNDLFVPQLPYTSDNCDNRDVVVHAELSAPTITVTTPNTGSGWTVRGNVDITRIFSSSGHYTCVWAVRKNSGSYTDIVSKSPTLDPPTSGTSVRTGQCDFPDRRLPSDPGTYTYRVAVSPGQTEKTDSSLVIETPGTPVISCEPSTGYVAEDGEVRCTCNGTVGQPGGQLRWIRERNNVITALKDGQYGDVTLPLTLTVNRDHNGSKLRCDVNWITDVTGPEFTLQVVYGPDSAVIPQDETFYTDSTGSRDLSLTCEPHDVSPTSGLTYSWTGRCAGTTTNTCSFKPRPPGSSGGDDVGAVIRCDVRNSENNNKVAQATYSLQLKYPPPQAPQISSDPANDILYEGDSLTLTCRVNGGDPVVTSVTLRLTGHSPSTRNGQSSSVSLTSLQRGDNGSQAVCSARWAVPEYYTLTGNRTLVVYYPPSTPGISRIDGSSLPPIEGDVLTLTCSVNPDGYPSAELTWPSEGSNVITNPLPLTVTRGDNQRSVTCQASNGFTRHKNMQLTTSFTLQVYYGPYISLGHGDDNNCILSPDQSVCEVTEGQRVHVLCEADSNPAPQQCAWQVLSPPDINLDPGSDLDIGSANRTDSGVYQVQVETTKPGPNDNRLPLKAQRNFTVLVKYQPTDPDFRANNVTTLTVNENEAVRFQCQSHGRPTPGLELYQRDLLLASEEGGKLSLSEERTVILHTITAGCSNTGTVTCRGDNGVGHHQSVSVQLYVNCKPRNNTAPPEIPEVNFIGNAVGVAFYMEAYPVPNIHSFQYLGSSQDSTGGKPVPDSIDLSADCINTYADYAIMCNVSVNSVNDSAAEGFYVYTAANAFGDQSFVFQVKVNASTGGSSSGSLGSGAAVGLGVALAVVLVLILVIVLWRRGWRLPCAEVDNHGQANDPQRIRRDRISEQPSHVSPMAGDYEMMEDGSPRIATENQPPSVYPSLQTSDIGVPSVYPQISPYQNVGPAAGQENQPPSVYSSLQTSDIGVPSVYSQISPYQNVGPAASQENQPPSVYSSLQTSDIGVPSVYSQISRYQNVGPAKDQGRVYENDRPESRTAYVNLPHESG